MTSKLVITCRLFPINKTKQKVKSFLYQQQSSNTLPFFLK